MTGTEETLLSPSAVKLYGRVIAGLTVDLSGAAEALGMNQFSRRASPASTASAISEPIRR